MEDVLKEILTKLSNIDAKIDTNHKELIDRLDKLEDRFEDLEGKNATRHTEIYNISKLAAKDVKFIKHKLHETEEDVFDIKDHLKIIK